MNFNFGTNASTAAPPAFGVAPPAFGQSASATPAFGQPQISTASTFGQPAGSGGLFGGTPSTASTFGATNTAAPLFGAASNTGTVPAAAFGQIAKPTFGQQTTSAAAPTFGANITPAFGATASTPAFGATSTAPKSTFGTPTATPAFGGLTTSNASGTPALPAFGAQKTATTSAAFGFGGIAAPAGTIAASAPTAFGGFGNVAKTTASITATGGLGSFGSSALSTTSAPVATASSSGLSFGSAASTSSAPGIPTTSTIAPTVGQSSSTKEPMKFADLEDAINRWALDLQEQEKVFLDQSTQINAWDRLLIDNGNKINDLDEAVNSLTLEQERLEFELDFVKSLQNELEESLSGVEQQVGELPVHNSQHASASEVERRKTYDLALSLDAQLQRIGVDIKEVVEYINASNASSRDSHHTSEPGDDTMKEGMKHMSTILNAHMDSLEAMDKMSNQVQHKLELVSDDFRSMKNKNGIFQ